MAASMMQSVAVCSASKAFGSRPSSRSVRAVRTSTVVVQAHKVDEIAVSRREAAAAGLMAAATLLNASPALAGLFGDGGEAKYVEETTTVINSVSAVLALDRSDASYDDAVKKARRELNDWVAKYRRDKAFSGRPSFGNVYSALNALAGHYNNFGTNAPIPKKRLERINKELEDGAKLVTRGR